MLFGIDRPRERCVEMIWIQSSLFIQLIWQSEENQWLATPNKSIRDRDHTCMDLKDFNYVEKKSEESSKKQNGRILLRTSIEIKLFALLRSLLSVSFKQTHSHSMHTRGLYKRNWSGYIRNLLQAT